MLLVFAVACGGGAQAAPSPLDPGIESSDPAPVVTAIAVAEIEYPEGLRPLAELPEVCRLLILDDETYPAKSNWRGCATCNREVGFALGEVRLLYEAVGDPLFLAGRDAIN